MMRGMTILWTVLAVIIGIGLFLLKYEVKSLEGTLAGINHDIRQEQEAIHVLKAEWSYLNDPERLRDLNERHLAMKPVRGEQLASIADLPMAPPRQDEPEHAPTPAPAPDSRVMVDAAPAQPAPATRALPSKPVVAAAAPPARNEPPKTVVAAAAPAAAPAKPQPLKTETTPKPIVGKSEPVRSEALQSAFAAAKPANPKPVQTTPSPAAARPVPVQPYQPARLPSGAVVTQNAGGDVMVIKSPALIAAEAAAGGQR